MSYTRRNSDNSEETALAKEFELHQHHDPWFAYSSPKDESRDVAGARPDRESEIRGDEPKEW